MKIVFLLLCVIAAATASEWVPRTVDEVNVARKECMAENPVPAESIEKMKMFEYPDVEVVRKYVLCSVKKLEVFCEDEGYHADRVAKVFRFNLDEAEALEIAKKCADKNEEKSSVDVWAFRGYVCLLNSKLGEGLKEYVKKHNEAKKA